MFKVLGNIVNIHNKNEIDIVLDCELNGENITVWVNYVTNNIFLVENENETELDIELPMETIVSYIKEHVNIDDLIHSTKENTVIFEQAKKFVQTQFELSKIKLPSYHDYTGRDAYKRFLIDVRSHSQKLYDNQKFRIACEKEYGQEFWEQVDIERLKIGKMLGI